MKQLIDFIKSENIEKTNFFKKLKCSKEEGIILQYLTKEYVRGRDAVIVIDVLTEFYDVKAYEHLEKTRLNQIIIRVWMVRANCI